MIRRTNWTGNDTEYGDWHVHAHFATPDPIDTKDAG